MVFGLFLEKSIKVLGVVTLGRCHDVDKVTVAVVACTVYPKPMSVRKPTLNVSEDSFETLASMETLKSLNLGHRGM